MGCGDESSLQNTRIYVRNLCDVKLLGFPLGRVSNAGRIRRRARVVPDVLFLYDCNLRKTFGGVMPPYNPPTAPTTGEKPSTLELYLKQWVKIASGERVYIASGVKFPQAYGTYSNQGYLVFKCKECLDNWHVGLENFYGGVVDPNSEVIPSVLSDWVKKHRHVCKKFNDPYPPVAFEHPGLCKTCKWPYGAHEESWNPQIAVNTTPTPKAVVLKAETPTGRKFRDTEDLCE